MTNGELERRVAKLERELRIWRCAPIAAAAVIGLGIACKQAPPSEIQIGDVTIDGSGIRIERAGPRGGRDRVELSARRIVADSDTPNERDRDAVIEPGAVRLGGGGGLVALDVKQDPPSIELHGQHDEWIQLGILSGWAMVTARHDADHYIQMIATPDGGKLDARPAK